MGQETALGRLKEIRSDWEIELDISTASAQAQLLPKIEAWLKEGEKNPARVLRAVQILALPERTDSHRRPCLTSLGTLDPSALETLGRNADRRRNAQALVLAVWGEGLNAGWFRLGPLLLSSWEVQPLRSREEDPIGAWLQRVQRTLAGGGPVSNAAPPPPALPSLALAAVPEDPNHWGHLENNVGVGWNYSQFGTQLVSVLRSFRDTASSFASTAKAWDTAANASLKTWSDAVWKGLRDEIANSKTHDRERELLWWGQARYSHTLNKPLRRIENLDERMLIAAREVADRSAGLPVGPVAAYLVEVLHALDADPNRGSTRQSLRTWCESLHSVSGSGAPVAPTLAKLTEEDATALPVTWTRLRAQKHETLDRFEEATGLPADALLDRDQWASWVLRELMLDRELKSTQ